MPISLLSHIYKLLMIEISERVRNVILKDIPNNQAAYQEGRSTNEKILQLKQIIEKYLELNKPIHIVFIDYLKAFGSVSQDAVWKALEKTDINKNLITIGILFLFS